MAGTQPFNQLPPHIVAELRGRREMILRLQAEIQTLQQGRVQEAPAPAPAPDEAMNIVSLLREGEEIPKDINLDLIQRLPILPGILDNIIQNPERIFDANTLKTNFIDDQELVTGTSRLLHFESRKLDNIENNLISHYSLKLAKLSSSFSNQHKMISEWITLYAASEPPKHVQTKIQGFIGTNETRDLRKLQTSLSVHADNIRSKIPTLFRLVNTIQELVEEFNDKLKAYYEQQKFIDPIRHLLRQDEHPDQRQPIPRLSDDEYTSQFRSLCSNYSTYNVRYTRLLSEVNKLLGTFSLRHAEHIQKMKLQKEAKALAFEKAKDKKKKEATALLSRAGVDTIEEKLEAIAMELLSSKPKNVSGRKNNGQEQAGQRQIFRQKQKQQQQEECKSAKQRRKNPVKRERERKRREKKLKYRKYTKKNTTTVIIYSPFQVTTEKQSSPTNATFFNFSKSFVPTPSENRLLTFGTKHVFKAKPLTITELRESRRIFLERLNTMYKHRNATETDPPFNPNLHIKSRFKLKLQEDLTHYFNQIKTTLDTRFNYYICQTEGKPSVDPYERIARKLTKIPNLKFTLADKNLGIVCLDRDDYDSLILTHLQSDSYKKMEIHELDKFYDETLKYLEGILLVYFDTDEPPRLFTDQIAKFLRETARYPRDVPLFYALIKIHKIKSVTPDILKDVSIRPIVACTNWLTTNAAKVLSEVLKPFSDRLPTILKDSRRLIRETEGTIVSRNALLFSMDIVNFYGNMDKEKVKTALISLNEYFEANGFETIPTWVLHLLDFVLSNNIFSFKDALYQQQIGLAMGINCAPVIANLYAAAIFDIRIPQHLRQYYNFFYRYIDDSFALWDGPKDAFEEFKNSFNNPDHPLISITTVSHPEQLEFLDLIICLEPTSSQSKRLIFKCHQKQLNLYAYISDISDHPTALKLGFMVAELIRYVRNSSTQEDYLRMLLRFRKRIMDRGYSAAFFRKAVLKVHYSSRQQYLSPKSKVKERILPYVIRHNSDISTILQLGSYIHRNDYTLSVAYEPLIPPRIIISRTSNTSLSRILTHLHSIKYSRSVPLGPPGDINFPYHNDYPVKQLSPTRPAELNRLKAKFDKQKAIRTQDRIQRLQEYINEIDLPHCSQQFGPSQTRSHHHITGNQGSSSNIIDAPMRGSNRSPTHDVIEDTDSDSHDTANPAKRIRLH